MIRAAIRGVFPVGDWLIFQGAISGSLQATEKRQRLRAAGVHGGRSRAIAPTLGAPHGGRTQQECTAERDASACYLMVCVLVYVPNVTQPVQCS